MAIEPISVLHTGVVLAAVAGLYGLLVGVFWSPFLVAGRLRRLFDSLPGDDWRLNYALSIPLPAAIWGFVFGAVITLSRDVRPPTKASPLYVAGVDGIVSATVVSLLLWPLVLVYVLPEKGIDWDPGGYGSKTVALVVASLVWYLLFLVGPAYVFTLFAGFGDAMSGP